MVDAGQGNYDEHHLDRSESLEVDIEELEYYLLGPEESDAGILR